MTARSASCRARLSAFNSALLLAGLSTGAAHSEAGTGTEAGTAEGAEREREREGEEERDSVALITMVVRK